MRRRTPRCLTGRLRLVIASGLGGLPLTGCAVRGIPGHAPEDVWLADDVPAFARYDLQSGAWKELLTIEKSNSLRQRGESLLYGMVMTPQWIRELKGK